MSPLDIGQQKQATRLELLTRRRQMGAPARVQASAVICEKIKNLAQYQAATCIAAFAPMAEEVDIWPLIEDSLLQNKTVALPRVVSAKQRQLSFHQYSTRAELTNGYMGILEPTVEKKIISWQSFDFIIVPAVAIAKNKKRLGYGGGFYDKVLTDCNAICSCAAVFRCQRTETLPCEKHDQFVFFAISE